MEAIVTASQWTRRTSEDRRFKLLAENWTVASNVDVENFSATAKKACLQVKPLLFISFRYATSLSQQILFIQIWVQLHANKCRYAMLYNWNTAIIFFLKDKNIIEISDPIRKFANRIGDRFTILSALVELAILEYEIDPDIFYTFNKSTQSVVLQPRRLTGQHNTPRSMRAIRDIGRQ